MPDHSDFDLNFLNFRARLYYIPGFVADQSAICPSFRVQEPYRGRARFVQKLTFYMVPRPKIMFFMQKFKGFPMPQQLFQLSRVPQGFFPAKRAFCPFCHIYARALVPKSTIPQVTQAKINIICVEFQEFSNGVLTCELIACSTLFFSRQMCIFAFFDPKKIWQVTFKRLFILTFINRVNY